MVILLVGLVGLYFAYMFLSKKRRLKLRGMFSELSQDRQDLALKLAFEPPYEYIRAIHDGKAGRTQHVEEHENAVKHRKLMRAMKKSVKRSTAQRIGCWIYTNCFPVRTIVESCIEKFCYDAFTKLI
jgi:hypothetical protein